MLNFELKLFPFPLCYTSKLEIYRYPVSTLISHFRVQMTFVPPLCETEYLTKKLILKVSKYINYAILCTAYTHVIRYLRDANEKKKKSCCDTTKPSQVYFLIYYNFHRQTTIDATTDRRPPIIYINTGIVVKNPFLSRTDNSTLFRSHRNNRSLFLYDSLMWIFHVD